MSYSLAVANRTMHMRIVVLVPILLLCLEPAAFAATTTPTCTRELAAAETSLLKTLVHLDSIAKGHQDEKCAVYHKHVEIVTNAREVFVRCMTSPERETDIDQLDGSLRDTYGVIARSCGDQ